MTDPDSRRSISARLARSAAELVMRNQRDDPLKLIFSCGPAQARRGFSRRIQRLTALRPSAAWSRSG
jgi:hypothetical protein